VSDVQRHRKEDAREILLPVASASVIEIGDLCWLDPSTKQVKAADDFTYRSSLLSTQAHFAMLFVGVAQSASAAGDTVRVRVATGGVFDYVCASATFKVGDLIGPDDNATPDALTPQQVIAVTDSGAAIGVVEETEASAVTAVKVRVDGNAGLAMATLSDQGVGLEVVEFFCDFIGSGWTLSAPPAGWTVYDSSAAGTPTLIPSADEGVHAIEAKHDSQDEDQSVGLYMGDTLQFDIDYLLTFECRFRAPTVAAVQEVVIGMISEIGAPAALTEGAWISVDGDTNIDCESDDGTNRNDDEDSTVDLGNDVWCSLLIDFSDTSSVKFYLDAAGNGAYARVLSGTTFDLSNYTAGLQPAFWINKSGGATTNNLDVDHVRIRALRA
jgi:hypothetical protein